MMRRFIGWAAWALLAGAAVVTAQNGEEHAPPRKLGAGLQGQPTPPPSRPQPSTGTSVRLRTTWAATAQGLELRLVAHGTPGTKFIVLATSPASVRPTMIATARLDGAGSWELVRSFSADRSRALSTVEFKALATARR